MTDVTSPASSTPRRKSAGTRKRSDRMVVKIARRYTGAGFGSVETL